MTLSSTTGVISGTPTASGTFGFVIEVGSAGVSQTGTKSFTIVIAAPFSITTSSLPDGTFGAFYLQSLKGTGGTAPYSWSLISGSLPPGVGLTSLGVLSGTPAVAGVFAFTFRAFDAGNPSQSATVDLSIKIAPLITTSSLPNGATGTTYSQTLAASAGVTAYTWSVSSGSLPTGLSLSSSGVISGNPSAAGTFDFTVTLTDSSVPPLTASKALSITIQSGLTITTDSSLPLAVVSAFYLQNLAATGPASLTWSVISGIVPPGLTLTAGGSLAGTPAVAGTFNFTVQVTGGTPIQTATKAFRVVVNTALSVVTLPTLPGATPGAYYSVVLSAIGGVAPYVWTNSGTLPPGLSLSSDGVISGTPGGSGSFQFSVQVSDSFNPTQTATRTFSITVASTLTIGTASLPNGAVGVAYSQTLGAAGGTTPYTWSLQSGSLPGGLTMSSAGLINGTPTSGSTFNFSVTVTDASVPSQTASKSFVVTIQPTLTILGPTTLPLGVVGAFYSQLLSANGPSPLTWSVVSGIAPPGMSLTSSGSLAGTPLVAGTFDFTVEARGGDPVQTDKKALQIVVNDALKITTAANTG